MSTTVPHSRFHRVDGWRGYAIPALAVAGSSDTGTYSDSPCPTPAVRAELDLLRKALKDAGIASRVRYGQSSNVFCAKAWVCVSKGDFDKAAQLATNWLEEHRNDTQFIHDAGLDQLGYKVQEAV